MDVNVGATDARVRWGFAIALFVVAIVFNASPVITLPAALAALVLAGTALTHSCPLYRVLGIHSRRPRAHARHS
jgi:Inner membrane protein YgaP-like, transmembrane domain